MNLLQVLKNPAVFLETARSRLLPVDAAVKRMAQWRHGSLPRVDIGELVDKDAVSAIEIQRPLDRTVNTSVDLYEVVCLCALVRSTRPANVFEIGTFDGNTTVNIAANCPAGAHVHTLDLPPDWDGELELEIPDDYRNVTDRAVTGSQIVGSPYEDRITRLLGDSAKFDWGRLPQPLDFVFIDGNHHYEYVRHDSEQALRHVSPKSCVVWHDYGAYPDVSRAVDELSVDRRRIAIQGTRLAAALPMTPAAY